MTAPATTSATSAVTSQWALTRAFWAVAFVLGIAAVTGMLTPLGEIHLPRSISAAANSSGSWTLITFASVYVSRARGLFAALLGACSFVIMDVFFFVVFELRVGHYSHLSLAFWVSIATLVGPLVGLCASWLRSPSGFLREIAVAAPSSVLIGEGIFILARLPGVSTLYAVASVVVGVLLFAGLAAWRLPRAALVTTSLAICGFGSAAFISVYGLLPLVLDRVVP